MVDIPTTCKVCNANLNNPDDSTTCGVVCARILKYGESREVAVIRAKIDGRQEPCSPDCPGWAVFYATYNGRLEVCDDCWRGVADPLIDEDLDSLPEAEQELALAEKDGDAYDHPDVGPSCACGCVVRRTLGESVMCSACGAILSKKKRRRKNMFNVDIIQKYGGGAVLGPTDTRDEAARLARAWIEAHAEIISGMGGQANPVTAVKIEPVEEDES